MTNDTERNYRCVICGEKTPWMFRQKSICDACDTRIDKLVNIHAGPHTTSSFKANLKEEILKLCISFVEYVDDEGLSYAKAMRDIGKGPEEPGDISKTMARYIVFKEFARSINIPTIERMLENICKNNERGARCHLI